MHKRKMLKDNSQTLADLKITDGVQLKVIVRLVTEIHFFTLLKGIPKVRVHFSFYHMSVSFYPIFVLMR